MPRPQSVVAVGGLTHSIRRGGVGVFFILLSLSLLTGHQPKKKSAYPSEQQHVPQKRAACSLGISLPAALLFTALGNSIKTPSFRRPSVVGGRGGKTPFLLPFISYSAEQ
jgi:hypothetical protein